MALLPGGLTGQSHLIRSRNVGPLRIVSANTRYGDIRFCVADEQVESVQFWRNLPQLETFVPWGNLPLGKLQKLCTSERIQSCTDVLMRLRTADGGTFVAKILTFLNGKPYQELAELDTGNLTCVPIGGFSFDGRDVIVILEELGAVTVGTEILQRALRDGNTTGACDFLARVGELLGLFHAISARSTAAPPDTRGWNRRLRRLANATGYPVRRITSECGLGIFTHGDFHFGQVVESTAGLRIIDFAGEPLRRLFGFFGKFPAVRDVACGLRNIHWVLSEYPEQRYLENDLRRVFFEAWMNTAPRTAVANANWSCISEWEWDRALNEMFCRTKYGREDSDLREWFDSRTASLRGQC
jgi:hypothetical protein